MVFNPHAWPSKTPVELDIGGVKESDALVDDQGREVPVQLIRPPVIVSGWRRRLAFAAELPPLGYRTYRVLARPAPALAVPVAQIDLYMREISSTPSLAAAGEGRRGDEGFHADDRALENDRLRVEIDHATGCIASLLDKRRQIEVLLGRGARPVVIDDPSDTWGHGVYQFHDTIGAFAPTSVRLFERGAVRATIRVESAYGASALAQEFTLYRELDLVEVRVTLDWRERLKALKLAFPLNLNFQRATYEIPYGFVERPTNGEEEPGQSWLDLSGIVRGGDVQYGLALLNDGKYSFDVSGRELSMTVLRSPIYAHHHPTLPHPDEPYTFIDQGIQRFTYWLLPHAGDWESAGVVQRAAELNARPVALVESYHAGPLPQSASFLEVDRANVVVSALKRAEDGDDLIIRAYEAHRVATHATIRLPRWSRTIAASFGPCEIKTFRVPRDESQPVVETDLIERK